MIIPFGKEYLYEDVDFVIEIDPNYLIWASKQKNIANKYPEVISYIKEKLKTLEPIRENPNILNFGKYYGESLENVVLNDKSYTQWLLKTDSFKSEYPETYDKAKKYFELVHENNIVKNHIIFYVLYFKNRDYIKPGITSQHIARRIYNYAGIMTEYHNDNIDFSKSYAYLTNDINIESKVLKHFSAHKVDRKTERLYVKINDIEEYIDTQKRGDFYYRQKSLYDFIPYDDSFSFRESFVLKINQFVDFENLYIKHLIMEKLIDIYNPNFAGWNPN